MIFSWKKSIYDCPLLSFVLWPGSVLLQAQSFQAKANAMCLLLIRYCTPLLETLKNNTPTILLGVFIFFLLTPKKEEKTASDTLYYLQLKSM